jgi:glutamine synthetase
MEKIKNAKNLDFAKIFTTDLNGRIRSLQVNHENIESLVENGIAFDGSSIAGIGTIDDSDRLLIPITESFQVLELEKERVGFIIGNINDGRGIRSKSDPRAVLEGVLEKAKSKGFKFLIAPEHEFFLLTSEDFNENIHTDMAGYFHTDPHDTGVGVRKKIIKILNECGVSFEKAHHEVTSSQHEINLTPADPLTAADRTLLFHYIAKKVAKEHGYYASFMPKPFDDQNRSAFHIHLSMHSLAGKNLFYDAGKKYNLSRKARQFIGGILKYARETSIIMASTYNSYKAYVIEKEAPTAIGWGLKNRSSMVRVPYSSAPENMRIELRSPDPSGNVYLQVAALIAMGLKGMEEKVDCGDPDAGSNYARKQAGVTDASLLPKTMFEALLEAEKSAFLKEMLGDHIYKNYMALKTAEWEEHRTHVTPREHDKYLRL